MVPERTKAGYSFADIPVRISFRESNVVIYGVPLDITTSFGKGTSRGPEAIRRTSALQSETFMLDEKANIHDLVGIFDLGDLKLLKTKNITNMLDHLDSTIPKIVASLRNDSKIPVMLGGEHTLTYYQLKALAKEEPIVIHFDAHRDMKSNYESLKICHTTPFYHLLKYIPGENLIQIGIRQTDKEENETASKNGVTTFDACTMILTLSQGICKRRLPVKRSTFHLTLTPMIFHTYPALARRNHLASTHFKY
jgi:arginase family enzyme